MNDTVSERLVQLEIKLAYIEDFMQKIQGITVEQGKSLDILKSENKVLRQKLAELSFRQEPVLSERPPHY